MFKFLLLAPILFLGFQFPAAAQELAEPQVKSIEMEWELFSQIDSLRRESYCPQEDYVQAKADLAEIYESDVADRESSREDLSARDLDRRMKLAKIEAKGCLFEQDDYLIAALVYQHGQLTEHYLQAIIYANKAASLKKANLGPYGQAFDNTDGLQQVTIDRYLMSLGYKQLFGTQIVAPAFYKQFESDADGRPCVWPLDKAFDVKRDYTAGTVAYRQILEVQISAKVTQLGACKFPAKDSKHLLEGLLNLEI